MYKRLFPTTEAIKYQGDRFFKKLTETISQLQEDEPNPYKWTKVELARLADVVKKETLIPVRVSFNDYGPAVNVPELSSWTSLSESTDNVTKTITTFTKSGMISGSIDLNTGKVKGDFTKIHVDIYLPPTIYMLDALTPEENAALILHELGHVMVYYEYLSRAIKTNFAIKQIVDNLTGNDTVTERKTILLASLDGVMSDDLNVDKLALMDKPTQIATVIVADQRARALSEIGSDIYDMVNWEFLADQYLTKHGAGRAFMIAYDRLFKYSRARPTHTHLMVEAMKAVGMTITAPLSVWILPLTLVMSNPNSAHYDRPELRLTRIRNQMIESLKDKFVSIEMKKQIRSDIEYVDTIIKPGKDKLTFVHYLLKSITGFNKERLKQEQLQSNLERLASNDLFIKAFDLEQLT